MVQKNKACIILIKQKSLDLISKIASGGPLVSIAMQTGEIKNICFTHNNAFIDWHLLLIQKPNEINTKTLEEYCNIIVISGIEEADALKQICTDFGGKKNITPIMIYNNKMHKIICSTKFIFHQFQYQWKILEQ